jgi:hypothetical protein
MELNSGQRRYMIISLFQQRHLFKESWALKDLACSYSWYLSRINISSDINIYIITTYIAVQGNEDGSDSEINLSAWTQ